VVRIAVVNDNVGCCCIFGEDVYAVIVTLDDFDVRIGRLEDLGNLSEHRSDVVLWMRRSDGVQDGAADVSGATGPGKLVSTIKTETMHSMMLLQEYFGRHCGVDMNSSISKMFAMAGNTL